MALIDVTELMVDPDFVNSFSIIRRVDTINSKGENILNETTVNNIIGSIQGAGKDTIRRLPEDVQVSRVKTVYTKTLLQTDAAGKYADLIVIDSYRYAVINVTPWNNFGAGWYECDCVMEIPIK